MPDAAILIIDDDASMLRFLRNVLEGQSFRILTASSMPDLVLLDLGLPDVDGLEVLGQLRGWSKVPVIILSARGQEQDKIKGLDSGADDYLSKPFSTGELMARIRECLRRQVDAGQPAGEPVFQTGGLLIDLSSRQVFLDDSEIKLTPIEYKLLTEFVKHAGKVLTHRHLLKEVWNIHNDTQIHYVRIFVHQLRQKIEVESSRPKYLLSEPGVGYRHEDTGNIIIMFYKEGVMTKTSSPSAKNIRLLHGCPEE